MNSLFQLHHSASEESSEEFGVEFAEEFSVESSVESSEQRLARAPRLLQQAEDLSFSRAIPPMKSVALAVLEVKCNRRVPI